MAEPAWVAQLDELTTDGHLTAKEGARAMGILVTLPDKRCALLFRNTNPHLNALSIKQLVGLQGSSSELTECAEEDPCDTREPKAKRAKGAKKKKGPNAPERVVRMSMPMENVKKASKKRKHEGEGDAPPASTYAGPDTPACLMSRGRTCGWNLKQESTSVFTHAVKAYLSDRPTDKWLPAPQAMRGLTGACSFCQHTCKVAYVKIVNRHIQRFNKMFLTAEFACKEHCLC